MATKHWSDLSPRTRRLVVGGAAFDGLLRAAALLDLARRRPEEVRGSKRRWAAALLLVNSVGALPIVYFAYGRRRSTSAS